jgi:catechol 2,3-dioxygenase-like lactoylglutathione lyase family enzyme
VALPVTDQDRAVEFYVGRLGFENGGMCRSGQATQDAEADHASLQATASTLTPPSCG